MNVNSEVILFSFPKCGRTWIRYLFLNLYGKILAAEHVLAAELMDRKKIVLIRDPRDVMVSYFYEVTKRAGFSPYDSKLVEPWVNSEKSLSHFIRIGTVDQFFCFYYMCIDIAEPKLLLRYEDLHSDPVLQLRRLDDFLKGTSLTAVSTIEDAVLASTFEKMRDLESSGQGLPGEHYQGTWLPNLTPADPSDYESYKTRSGKVGEFRKRFSEEDKCYFMKLMRGRYSEVLSYYGYQSLVSD